MITPMRRFSMNITELFLSDLGNVVAVLLMVLAVGAALYPSLFESTGFWGGALAAFTLTSGVLLGLGSGGLRQNRPVFDLALRALPAIGIGWLVLGIAHLSLISIVLGVVIVVAGVVCWIIHRAAIWARFIPRFFSLRQFGTMVQIADAMLDADDLALHPIEVAIRADHLLAEIDSPIKQDIKRVMFLVEWLLPLIVLRPFPFSSLGTHERRRIIRKVIWSRGLFRDVARTLKLLSTFTYYTHPDAQQRVGYIEFDQRDRAQGLDQTPKPHPLPVEEGVSNDSL